MATLLDILKKQRQGLAGTPTGMADNTGLAQGLLRGRTGKAVSGGLAGSAMQEQAATQEADQARLSELQPGLETQQLSQELQSSDIAAKERSTISEIKQTQEFNTVRNRLQLNGILQDLSRQRGELGTQQAQSQLEQAGFILSMQDKKYVDDLQRIGNQRRMSDKMRALSEMQDVVFGDTLSAAQRVIGQENILATNRRAFQTATSNMKIQQAIQIAEIERRRLEEGAAIEREGLQYGADQTLASAAIRNRYEGLSGIISGGMKGVEAYSSSQDNKKTKARQDWYDKQSGYEADK